jgi:hypothetical protein
VRLIEWHDHYDLLSITIIIVIVVIIIMIILRVDGEQTSKYHWEIRQVILQHNMIDDVHWRKQMCFCWPHVMHAYAIDVGATTYDIHTIDWLQKEWMLVYYTI